MVRREAIEDFYELGKEIGRCVGCGGLSLAGAMRARVCVCMCMGYSVFLCVRKCVCGVFMSVFV